MPLRQSLFGGEFLSGVARPSLRQNLLQVSGRRCRATRGNRCAGVGDPDTHAGHQGHIRHRPSAPPPSPPSHSPGPREINISRLVSTGDSADPSPRHSRYVTPPWHTPAAHLLANITQRCLRRITKRGAPRSERGSVPICYLVSVLTAASCLKLAP